MKTGVPLLLTVELEGGSKLRGPVARLQILSQKYGYKPTWLIGFDALAHPDELEPLARWQRDGEAEVGAWLDFARLPPDVDITPWAHHAPPVLTDFPEAILDERLRLFTERLEKLMGRRPSSARVSPASVDDRYYTLLARYGYKIDLTVVPHAKLGSSDFSGYSEKPYLTPQGILEIPRTVRRWRHSAFVEDLFKLPRPWGELSKVLFPPLRCLNLRRGNRASVRNLLRDAEKASPEHLDLRISLRNDGRAELTVRLVERLLLSVQSWTTGMTAKEFLRQMHTSQLRKGLV